jgi:hypothetical protein
MKITAVYHTVNKEWSVESTDAYAPDCDMHISFTSETTEMSFNDIKFGYKLTLNNTVISENNYPLDNIKLETAVSGSPVAMPRFTVTPGVTYSLHLWAEDAGQRGESDTVIEMPKPEQPFPSWTWDTTDNRWSAPVQHATDGKLYTWNEETRSWTVNTETVWADDYVHSVQN